jgi:DNA-binding CsgD family transcriptional regulator
LLAASGRTGEHIRDEPIAIDMLTPLDRALGLVADGRLIDAERDLRSAYNAGPIGNRSSMALTASGLAWVLVWLGRPAEGTELARRAALILTGSGHGTLAKWAWLVTGLTGATARSPDTVDEALAELARFPMQTSLDGYLSLVVAGRHLLAYDRDAAHRTLVDGAAAAAASGRWFEEACHLHELVNLDGGSTSRLAELAAEHGGLVTLFADHAAAMAEGDEALADVAERFADIGAAGIASQVMAQAAEAAAAAGRTARARRWGARWDVLAANCDAPVALAPNTSANSLTPREREIALMAVDGHSSREVADRFGLSVRTVDNHLAHVFTKLGVVSRAELRDALGRADHTR